MISDDHKVELEKITRNWDVETDPKNIKMFRKYVDRLPSEPYKSSIYNAKLKVPPSILNYNKGNNESFLYIKINIFFNNNKYKNNNFAKKIKLQKHNYFF